VYIKDCGVYKFENKNRAGGRLKSSFGEIGFDP
jgi:hypothetical protein